MGILMEASEGAQNYTTWIARKKSDFRPLCNQAGCGNVEMRKDISDGKNRHERHENDACDLYPQTGARYRDLLGPGILTCFARRVDDKVQVVGRA
jgi:hypothetical protein